VPPPSPEVSPAPLLLLLPLLPLLLPLLLMPPRSPVPAVSAWAAAAISHGLALRRGAKPGGTAGMSSAAGPLLLLLLLLLRVPVALLATDDAALAVRASIPLRKSWRDPAISPSPWSDDDVNGDDGGDDAASEDDAEVDEALVSGPLLKAWRAATSEGSECAE